MPSQNFHVESAAVADVSPIPSVSPAPAQPAAPSSMAQIAAQERVSASELASALAAIETRRTTSARFDAGSITVGEAIEQLNLDIAPSEVLTEILAQREQKIDEKQARRKKRQRSTFAAFSSLAVLGMTLGTAALFTARQSLVSPSPPALLTTLPPEAPRVFNPQTLRVRDRDARTNRVLIRTLAEVEDNRPVIVLSSDLTGQFALRPKEDWVVNTQSPSESAEWTLIKHKGVPYLRGYIGARMSPAALASGDVIVSNQSRNPSGLPIGPDPSPITLRLDALRGTTDNAYDNGGAAVSILSPTWERITLPGLKGDSYLWER